MNSDTILQLPLIHSVSISSFPLFKQDWSFSIDSGLNIFLGVNGLGKTTTIKMLIYGLVGLEDKQFSKRVFKDYFPDNSDLLSSVTVLFSCGGEKFRITRSLTSPKIESLSIDNNEVSRSSNTSLEELYREKLLKASGLISLNDLSFVLNFLLIREEEADYLFWDQAAQSRVFRLLFNSSKFQEKFGKFSEALRKADTIYRGNLDIKAQFQKNVDKLESLRIDQINSGLSLKNSTEIENEYLSVNESVEKLSVELDLIMNRIAYIHSKLEAINKQVFTKREIISALEDEKAILEKNFFTGAFNKTTLELAYNKLGSRNICIYCDSQISRKTAEAIISKIKIDCECPVCSSSINGYGIDTLEDDDSDRIASKINALSNKLEREKNELDQLLENKKQLETTDLNTILDRKKEKETQISNLNLKSFELKKKIDNASSIQTSFTDYDSAIKALKDRIEEYQEDIILPAKNDFDEAKGKLEKLNSNLNKTIEKFYAELNTIFNKMAHDYFSDGCSLYEISNKKPKGFELPLTFFVPFFNDKPRKFITRVSKYEGIMLEYIFRMSILTLYKRITGITPFMILETSEGSFDVSNTPNLSKALLDFIKENIPTLVVVNLSKIEFVNDLVSAIPENERGSRVFNFLDITNNSTINAQDSIYSDALMQVGLKK